MSESQTIWRPEHGLIPNRVVELGEMAVTDTPAVVLSTSLLGSCVGICMHDPEGRLGGIVHPMLPSSDLDLDRASSDPALFVDTGIELLLCRIMDCGADRDSLRVYVAGASQPRQAEPSSVLGSVGYRNVQAVERALTAHRLTVTASRTGGSRPLGLCLRVGDGAVVTWDHANRQETL